MDPQYQIYRTEKLKHMGNVGASGSHMMRSRPTPNADPDVANRILVGTSDPSGDVSRLLPDKGARGADGKLLRTAQSVLAIEVVVTTSPEWWDKSTPEMQEDWLRCSVRQLARQYGKDNIAHLQVHYDEKTPHITGFVVPRDNAGRLNAKAFLGTRAKMRKMQSDMAAAVEHLGLVRGIEGSKAEHQRVTRHYGQLKRKVRPIKIDAPSIWDFIRPSEYAEKQRRKAQKQASGLFERAKTTESAISAKKAAQATSESLSTRNKQLERDLQAERMRAEAAELRAIPLYEVAQALGLEQDRKDRSIWRGAGMKIGISAKAGKSKFFDNTAKKGGGGAIDLAMHAMGCDYKAALAWLAANFGSEATGMDAALRHVQAAKRDVSQAVKERPPFTPPDPVEANWPHVRAWLIDQRGLPAEEIDKLHESGTVYADDRRNVVFLAHGPDGKPTGAELKGTQSGQSFSGMAPGSIKSAGAFRMGRLTAKAVYLVESAIDAISLYVLRRRDGDKSLAVISAAGSSPIPPLGVTNVIPEESQRLNAYDADAPGDKAAAAMGWDRHRPEVEGADWNQMLKDQDDPDRIDRDVSPGA